MGHAASLVLLAVQLLALLPFGLADVVQDLQNRGRPQVDSMIAKSKTCTRETLHIRREWGDMPKDDRRAYIKAMLCLLERPPMLTQFPGVTNRYEDFVAVHINQTGYIHGTGNFLSWHRYYLWAFEQALREECGYRGTQPYWDWGRWSADPETSPVFDGTDTSLSGNGEYIPGHSFGAGGNGGGCVTTGPFKNMTIHLGPFANAVDPPAPPNPQPDGMGNNSRCLRRDISNHLTSHFGRPQDIAALINSSPTLDVFQMLLEGVHGVGHFTIAGDPGGDVYNSPGDPAFWVHHGMIDRTWAIWQSQDIENRTMTVAGMAGGFGLQGRMQSLDDPVDLGVVAKTVYEIRDLVSTVDGPFCYVYE